MELKPSEEQQSIIEAAATKTESIMANAYAGCAKSTSLKMAAQVIPEKNVLSVAFNVKNKKDMERDFPSHFTCKTMNGLGHAAFGKAIGKRLTLEERKISKLLKIVIEDNKLTLSPDEWSGVMTLVNEARKAGLIPDHFPQKGLKPDTPEAWGELAFEGMVDEGLYPIAREVLIESIKWAFQGTIDFDDQIYMSSLFNGVFTRYPLVLVDEYQDLNMLNIIQVKKSSSDRLIVVGDERQSIYGFRGANANAREDFKALKPAWLDLPLTTTFRCPKVIVARQQEHAPGFNAFHLNKPGRFHSFQDGWTWDRIKEIRGHPSQSITILCRNNAPLLSMALKLVKKRIGCTIMGGSLGKSLIALAKKILKNNALDVVNCIVLIDAWREDQVKKAQALGRDDKVSAINDRADCLQVVAEDSSVKDAQDLFDLLESIFAQHDSLIILSTIHKFKGLESDHVIHLDPHRIPSKWAKSALVEGNPVPMTQEKNLLYVGETRTKDSLINATLEAFS